LPIRSKFLTPVQDITINLVFAVMGEKRENRTLQDYTAIAARLPALKVLLYEINEKLRWMHRQADTTKVPLPQICRFQAGDQRYTYGR
jgi:hypothetical protein